MSLSIHAFTNNPFSENTYIVAAPSGRCAIIDPGMYDTNERNKFLEILEENRLTPVMLLNTHGHLDHVFSNKFCHEKFKLPIRSHQRDLETLQQGSRSASMYGLNFEESPSPEIHLEHGQLVELDEYKLEVRFCPGHSPGHVVFICHKEAVIIGGDVLFEGSVGRVDLPGGNAADLENSIRQQLYTLPDHFKVYPGHGNPTTIGKEKRTNYFVYEGGSRLL